MLSSLTPFPSSLSMSPRFHPLARLVLAAVAIVFAVVLVVVVIGAALQTASLASGRGVTTFNSFLANNALLVQTLLYPPALLALWACRRVLDRLSFRSLGLRARGSLSGFASGALSAVLALSLLFGVLWLCGLVRVNGFSNEYSKSGANALTMLSLYALAFIAVGFFEEVVFRGYALHNLKVWLGLKAAIVLQAVLFAGIHIPNIYADLGGGALTDAAISQRWTDARWGLINIALIGFFFALCYLKSGSLWFPIGFHAAWNFALGCLFSLPVSGLSLFRVLDVSVAPSWLTGGTFGLEGSVLLAPIIIAMCCVVSRLPNHAQALTDMAALGGKQTADEVAQNQATRNATVPDQNAHNASAPEAIGESHLAGIRASMRPSSPQPRLDFGGMNTMRPQAQTTSFLIEENVAQVAANSQTNVETNIANVATPTSSTRSDVQENVVRTTSENVAIIPAVTNPIEVVAAPVVAPIETAPVTTAPVETPSPETDKSIETPISETVTEPKPKPKKPAPKW